MERERVFLIEIEIFDFNPFAPTGEWFAAWLKSLSVSLSILYGLLSAIWSVRNMHL